MGHPSHVQLKIFRDLTYSIPLTSVHESNLTTKLIRDFLDTIDSDTNAIGVAPAFGTHGIVRSIALASKTNVLCITFGTSKQPNTSRRPAGRNLLSQEIFNNSSYVKAVFRSDRLGALLHLDLGLRTVQTVDLLEFPMPRPNPIDLLIRQHGAAKLHLSTVRLLFGDEKHGEQHNGITCRAWVAFDIYVRSGMHVAGNASMLDTNHLTLPDIDFISKLVRDADNLEALKPTVTKNDVKPEFSVKKGQLNVQSSRYKTRIQGNSTQTVRVEGQNRKKTRIVCDGRTVKVKGRAATINLHKQFSGSEIAVWTIGKDGPTKAESTRQDIVWKAFHRKNHVLDNSFVAAIWLSKSIPQGLLALPPSPPIEFVKPLNLSQEAAVKRILSDAEEDRLVVVHGPPGTGKTTVIAAATTSISVATPERSVWLVAQSNVAVKNIAEKLASVNFYKFRLLVSKEFHFDWHEHLYSKIERNVIRSDDFPNDHVAADRQLLDARVILCTLSMMSADKIAIFAKVAPVQMVIVDEASQIELGAYIPLLHTFSCMLAKLIFIGDDKQLPPFGQDDVPTLKSIFEIPHFRDDAIFLDTQYRMPYHIGNFISRHIYDQKLQTVHKDNSWRVCRFVDVLKGVEQKLGHSWTNQEEFAMILHVVRRLKKEGKLFRIITGYDAQRNLMENKLKAADLPWEDKVFNVDAFQGNEEDYILISVVRSSKPGFLSNERRANVMLSRCKRGMFIFSSRAFLGGPGAHTLVGRLAAECGERAWISSRQILNDSW